MSATTRTAKTYVVEHLDPELGNWSALEYKAIAKECSAAGTEFILSSVPTSLILPGDFADLPGFHIENDSVEHVHRDKLDRICLLDPAAEQELAPEDAARFDIFLFGGILGDDPPRDRTSELRKKGFQNRRLGPVQMTTDTAVRVTRIIIQQQGEYELSYKGALKLISRAVSLRDIPCIDHPEFKINQHESTQMPFRYVTAADGKPILPEGMFDLIKKDSEKSFGDLL